MFNQKKFLYLKKKRINRKEKNDYFEEKKIPTSGYLAIIFYFAQTKKLKTVAFNRVPQTFGSFHSSFYCIQLFCWFSPPRCLFVICVNLTSSKLHSSSCCCRLRLRLQPACLRVFGIREELVRTLTLTSAERGTKNLLHFSRSFSLMMQRCSRARTRTCTCSQIPEQFLLTPQSESLHFDRGGAFFRKHPRGNLRTSFHLRKLRVCACPWASCPTLSLTVKFHLSSQRLRLGPACACSPPAPCVTQVTRGACYHCPLLVTAPNCSGSVSVGIDPRARVDLAL